jgi:hypothetical protein
VREPMSVSWRPMSRPQTETAVHAAVSEIQRRLKERNFVLMDYKGSRAPVITTEEMNKLIMQFLDSASEGFG